MNHGVYQMIQSKQLFFTTVLRKATKNPHEKPSKVLIKSLDGQSTSKLEITDLKHCKINVYNVTVFKILN